MFLFSFFDLSHEVSLLLLVICVAVYFFLRQRRLKKYLPEDWSRWITSTQFQSNEKQTGR